jgi:hypothetical protein
MPLSNETSVQSTFTKQRLLEDSAALASALCSIVYSTFVRWQLTVSPGAGCVPVPSLRKPRVCYGVRTRVHSHKPWHVWHAACPTRHLDGCKSGMQADSPHLKSNICSPEAVVSKSFPVLGPAVLGPAWPRKAIAGMSARTCLFRSSNRCESLFLLTSDCPPAWHLAGTLVKQPVPRLRSVRVRARLPNAAMASNCEGQRHLT